MLGGDTARAMLGGQPGVGRAMGTSARWGWGGPGPLAPGGGGRASGRWMLKVFDSALLAPRHGQTDGCLNMDSKKTFWA